MWEKLIFKKLGDNRRIELCFASRQLSHALATDSVQISTNKTVSGVAIHGFEYEGHFEGHKTNFSQNIVFHYFIST